MINYKWVNTKYYLNEKDDITEIQIPYFNFIPSLNINNNNFYFLINNFFYLNKNTNSTFFFSNNTKNFKEHNPNSDILTSFPTSYNLSFNESSFLSDFFYLRNSSFIKFFINNMIDVPVCFKKSHSLKMKNFELPLMKFSNFLMKKGKKEKALRLVFSSFRYFFKNFKNRDLKINMNNVSWLSLYIFINNIFYKYNFYDSCKFFFNFENNISLYYNSLYFSNFKTIDTSFFLKNYFYNLLSKVSPVFSYFIYSVDKNIRKYSRGKSGKYTFIWKYIAPFKRIKLSMRWIVKDIKFLQHQKFSQRLIHSFENLLLNPEKSFAWKSKTFSHNYAFKNFKKSLLSSLRTTS